MKNEPTMTHHDNITDDEIRIVGSGIQFSQETMDDVLREQQPASNQDVAKDSSATPSANEHMQREQGKGKKSRLWLYGAIMFLVAILLAGLLVSNLFRTKNNGPTLTNQNETIAIVAKDTCIIDTLPPAPDSANEGDREANVLCEETVVNDVPLRIYTPEGGKIELTMERPSTDDKNLLLAAQAADVRSDIDAPAGAFVLHGELISKGHSKLGFCAILGNRITLGFARETPEFETAIEQDGYFFRHYSLVCQGNIVQVPAKGKAMRRALCFINDKVSIIECTDRESYQDFSQALVDLGCKEAVALVGGDALLYYYDDVSGQVLRRGYSAKQIKQSENYIVWRK